MRGPLDTAPLSDDQIFGIPERPRLQQTSESLIQTDEHRQEIIEMRRTMPTNWKKKGLWRIGAKFCSACWNGASGTCPPA